MRITAHTQDDTVRLASDIITLLKKVPHRTGKKHAAIVTMSGPLGAGKTFLTKCIAAAMGVSDTVISPTFILRRDYRTAEPAFPLLVHIDAYRLSDNDPDTIGLGEVSADPHTLIIIEWPSHIPSHIPFCTLAVFAHADGTAHTFDVVHTIDTDPDLSVDFLTPPPV